MDNMDIYLKGNRLYGDDFDLAQIEKWFNDEREGYANLGARDKKTYEYGYHALNSFYGFKYLPQRKYSMVLGIGSAYGDELKSIIHQVEKIIILEPTDAFADTNIKGIPVEYVKPTINGVMSFKDNTFDLITCFGVLHHIPNVSSVLNEIYRCLKPGGYLLLREPTISMGDWRTKRSGLTKNERGIPIDVLDRMIMLNGFDIVSKKRCMFSLTSKLKFFIKGAPYNSLPLVYLDSFLSQLISFNNKYHANNILEKIRPTSVFYILTK